MVESWVMGQEKSGTPHNRADRYSIFIADERHR